MKGKATDTARTALVRAFLLLILFAASSGLLYAAFGSHFDTAGRWLSRHFGYAGVFFFVLLVDTFIVPATADIVFFFTGGWNPYLLVSVISLASIAGGWCGFLIGGSLTHLRWVQEMTAYYREKGDRLIWHYGAWAVALAAFTPVPYSTISWIAGMLSVSPKKYLAASLLRIPRFAIYYLVMRGGIAAVETFF